MGEIKPLVKSHLLDETLLHDGATVLNPFGLACVPLVGYIVGMTGFTFDMDTLQPALWNGAMELVERSLGPLMVGPTRGVGSWKCGGQDGPHIHVDAVQWTNSEQHARAMCLQFDQRAYYDVEERKSVDVGIDVDKNPPPFAGPSGD